MAEFFMVGWLLLYPEAPYVGGLLKKNWQESRKIGKARIKAHNSKIVCYLQKKLYTWRHTLKKAVEKPYTLHAFTNIFMCDKVAQQMFRGRQF